MEGGGGGGGEGGGMGGGGEWKRDREREVVNTLVMSKNLIWRFRSNKGFKIS